MPIHFYRSKLNFPRSVMISAVRNWFAFILSSRVLAH